MTYVDNVCHIISIYTVCFGSIILLSLVLAYLKRGNISSILVCVTHTYIFGLLKFK